MKPILTLAALLLAALPCAPLDAQAPPAVRLEYEEETLPNGLKVIYSVDRSAPVASTVLWYDVGSKHEVRGRTGFAHLFEHLMLFTGSRNAPEGRHFGLLEAVGARAGSDINGTTSFDRTNYFQQVPSHALELALWLEADRMATLDEALNEGKLANQREVVKNERRQGMDNQPYGRWIERILVHMYPEEHPYRHVVLGSMEDLENASIEDVRGFFRTYYVPNNAVLVVAGDIDVPQVRQMVRRYFGGIPGGAEPPPVRRVPLPPHLGASPREVIPDANAPAPAVYVGFRMPSARDPRDNAVSLLGQMLGARSSALYDRLVRQQQIATSVGAFNLGLVDGADAFFIIAQGKPGANADSLEAALMAQLSDLGPNLSDAALERARAQQRFGFINGLQATGGFGGRADLLAMGATYFNDPGWVNRQLAESDQVTLAQLQALVRERLTPDNRVVLVYVPAAQPSTSGGN